jgi:hypothetical protein
MDDVCTYSSTLRACAARVQAENPSLDIVASTAGQMTVRTAVTHEEDLVVQAVHRT